MDRYLIKWPIFLILSGAMFSIFFSCTPPSSNVGAIKQNRLCETSELAAEAVAKVCEPGQKTIFLPKTFGNEQMPVMFAALHCDHRYQIALTNGAVSCIYLPSAIDKK